MPVAIRVGTASGDMTVRAYLTRRQDTIVVRDVKTAPTMVVFDDGNAILKHLSFDQPTAWLAMQLHNDPNLWNRHWVITQLSQRPKDSLAAAAVVRAATSADYFRVRMAAIEALAAFPGAAMAPLRAAVGDTSAQVRAAALEVLGVVGGPEAAALARRAWSRDSSDAVRAAAVTALALTDSSNRRTIVLEALKTPSYREALQLAAYRVIAGTGDTTLIDSVVARAGEDRYALHVLAALAARGSVRALDLLVKHLDDQRSYVRRWGVEAVRFSLPRPIGQPRLQALSAEGGLRFADTRQAIADLLQQWQGSR
jgi:hypothetical protein